MQSRAEYERAIEVVREVVHRWDPYKLLAAGSPADEFNSEIASVVAQIPRIRSRNDAAHALSRVFSSAFEAETFSPEMCRPSAELYEALLSHRLIRQSPA